MSDSSDYRRVDYFIRTYKKKELREKRRNEYEQTTGNFRNQSGKSGSFK